MRFWKLGNAILFMSTATLVVVAQGARVDVSKHLTSMPKSCELLVPARIDGQVDIPALVKEAICKGSGDMLGDYTYVTHSIRRVKDKKGKEKIETYTYEVFFPTLKSGARTKGILVVTSHNGVPVPADELEKDRMKAAEKTEKEEAKIASETPAPPKASENNKVGMLPLGSYYGMSITHESFGSKHSARLSIHTYLKTCDLTFLRRDQIEGRETLIFSFTPRPDTQFGDNEKYIAQLTGEIWIDAADRVVTKLVGWLANGPALSPTSTQLPPDKDPASLNAAGGEKTPVVYAEMRRLPKQGIWLPHITRIDGADYPTLFDGIKVDSTHTNTDYIRFSTDIKDVKIGEANKP